MNPPTVLQALSLGIRAAGRSLWLVPAAFGMAVAGQLAAAPAAAFLGAVAVKAFQAGGEEGGASGGLAAAIAALGSPRVISIWLGLWLVALLLRGALRVL